MDFRKVSRQVFPQHPLLARLPDSIKDGIPYVFSLLAPGRSTRPSRAIAIARGYAFAPSGIDAACVPSFRRASEINGDTRTGIRFCRASALFR